jgi:AraC-like DNA-binding protein
MIAGGAQVTVAALATGFQNLSHFSKAFRLVKVMSPREFAASQRRRTLRVFPLLVESEGIPKSAGI